MENQHKRQTNLWDVLIVLINGFFNLLKIEKIACLAAFYLLLRDAYFAYHIKNPALIEKYLINTKLLDKILLNDNNIIVALGVIIIILIMVVIGFVLVIKLVYKKEIERLAKLRTEILHSDGKPLETHHTSSKNAGKE